VEPQLEKKDRAVRPRHRRRRRNFPVAAAVAAAR
jgi:hypothetical protein